MQNKIINLFDQKEVLINSNCNYYIFSLNNSSINTNIIVTKGARVFIYVLSSNSNKNIKITTNNSPNSNIKCKVICFCKNNGNINIEFSSNINKTNSVCEQNIFGIIFDKTSSIKILPAFFIKNNKMLATHTASIGSFDINQLFYLATKNIYDSEARKMLLKSNLCDIQNIIDVSKYYNEIIDWI